MGYTVTITPRAIKDLEGIVRYISKDNSQIAQRFAHELIDRALTLSFHPELGRSVPELDNESIRELIHKSYRIVYRVLHRKELIQIIRFWHGARGTPIFEVRNPRTR